MNKAAVVALAPLLISGGFLESTPATSSAGAAPEPESDVPSALALEVESQAEGEVTWTSVAAARPAGEGAACDVNIRGRNTGSRVILLWHLGDGQSQVRTRIGTWKNVFLTSIMPGATYQHVLRLTFHCNAARRYRFRLEQRETGKRYTYYYPSSSSFTTSTTVDLGDVNRFF